MSSPLVGPGGGGCMTALCTPENLDSVKTALSALDAPTWKFKVIQ